MIWRLALRSLAMQPLRTIVLSVGFGLGVAVMAILLGVGEVVLQESRSPALQGGGDILVSGVSGSVESARFVLSSLGREPRIAANVAAASPWKRATVYLLADGRTWPVVARGGVPSLERAVGDREIAGQPAWTDEPRDRAWSQPAAGPVLRAMDRFHPVPDAPEFARSWAEWLYFNGRTADGRTSFYLTFLVGAETAAGQRAGGVRLQLERDGVTTNFSATADLDARAVLEHAPDLDIAGNQVRLEGAQYRITLRVPQEGRTGVLAADLTLDASALHSVPPLVMRGAHGWLSGYTVPVLSGPLRGTLGGQRIEMAGYHDHNWGFWEGVRWQWGQVAHDDLSFVFGRVFPPPRVADPARVPGFLAVLGREGVLGVATRVSIDERAGAADVNAAPAEVEVVGTGNDVDLRLTFTVDRVVRTAFGLTRSESPVNFLQLAGTYRVAGHAAGRRIEFTSRGAAETFR